MRGARGTLDVGTGAGAGIDEICVRQASDDALIVFHTPGLHSDFTVPVEAEPLKIGYRRFGRTRTHSAGVQVFHPKEKPAIRGSRRQPGDQEGAGVAEVETTGRRGGEAANDGDGGNHGELGLVWPRHGASGVV